MKHEALAQPAQEYVPLVEIEYNLSVADIKTALARPAQEDEEVCSHCGSYCHERDELDKAEREIARLQKIIDAPKRPWVGLTDKEISEAYNAAWKKAEFGMGIERKDVYEAIEAKLKEKNQLKEGT